LFVQLLGAENGHVQTVYGVQSLPTGTPVMVEVILRDQITAMFCLPKWTEREIPGLCLPTIKPDFQRSVFIP
jgi:hypothetical protein